MKEPNKSDSKFKVVTTHQFDGDMLVVVQIFPYKCQIDGEKKR